PGIEEQLRAEAAVEVGATAGQVAAERLGGRATDRDDALLVSLADRPDEPLVEVDGCPFEPDRLAHAQAAAVQQLDERCVPEGAWSGADGGLDQALGLAWRERPGQLGATARRLERGGGIGAARPQ